MKLTNSQKIVLVYLLTMLNLMVLLVVVLTYDNYRYKEYYKSLGVSYDNSFFSFDNGFVLTLSIAVSIVLSLLSLHFIVNQFKQKREKVDELDFMNQTKDKFISILGHDLKGPAIHLYSLSEILMKQDAVKTNDEVSKLIGMLHYSAKKHYDLLNNLLDWSVLKSGKIELKQEECSIRDIVFENFSLLEARALEKNIVFQNEVSENEVISSDTNFINTVLRNLLSNAIKYSKSNGKVRVASHRDGSCFYVSVIDNGVGMSKEVQNSLFCIDRKNSQRGTKGEVGTGIGLMICKEFIESNGGELTVESDLNKGAKFTFSIPYASHVPQRPKSLLQKKELHSGRRIPMNNN